MKSLLGILLLLFAEISFAGGGGCDGECPPAPASETLYLCEIVDVVVVHQLSGGAHRSFNDAQEIENNFTVGTKLKLLGGGNQINFVSLDNMDFDRYSGDPKNSQFFQRLTWGSYEADYPLVEGAIVEVFARGKNSTFSVSFVHADTIMSHRQEIQTLSGHMNCH